MSQKRKSSGGKNPDTFLPNEHGNRNNYSPSSRSSSLRG